MKLDNKYIHDQCALVEEDNFKVATDIGMKMLDFVRKENYVSIAANQVGYNMQIAVVMDDDGHDIYFNPEIRPQEIKDGIVSIAPEEMEIPINLPSFPKKRVLCQVYDKIEVDVFSVANDDRITFKAEGELAKVWQVTAILLGGVHPDSIVPCDYQTIKGREKKRPNDKCPDCGYKNKKCRCPETSLTL